MIDRAKRVLIDVYSMTESQAHRIYAEKKYGYRKENGRYC